MKLFLTIGYLGTNYCGYQVQPGKPTVQKALNEAAKALFGFDCDVVGCSRTDSGVHATCFCATLSEKGKESLPVKMDASKVPLALSAHLPRDIAVYDAKWVEDDFHARYDVKEKEYLYRICNRAVRDPFEEGRACHVPVPIGDDDLARMKEAAAYFVGKHDFSAFRAVGSKETDPVRTVFSASVERKGDLVLFRVAANGFLYHMVRIMAGTLLEVASGKRTTESVKTLLEDPTSGTAGMTAPAEGLYLVRVTY